MEQVHMGKLLEKVIRKKNLNISALAKAIGVDRRSFYNWFKKDQLDAATLKKIAGLIYEFPSEFPDFFIPESKGQFQFWDDFVPKLNDHQLPPSSQKTDDEYWKDKYNDLMQQVVKLRTKM